MNYRHAYHAGNFADVLKHVVFALAIDHLKKKEAPFRIIDTHAVCAAANGDFVRAINLQEQAVKRRREQEKAEMGELELRLAQFQAGKRYVEPRPN